jgi:hypothetical protein
MNKDNAFVQLMKYLLIALVCMFLGELIFGDESDCECDYRSVEAHCEAVEGVEGTCDLLLLIRRAEGELE